MKHTRLGFTIIEIVLVMAIAGLLFLMVFIALPALQRSQRDVARKHDVGIVAAAVQSFYAAGNGQLQSEDGFNISCTQEQIAAGITDCRDDEGVQWGTANNSKQLGPFINNDNSNETSPNKFLSSNSTLVGVYVVNNPPYWNGTYGRDYRIGDEDKAGHISVFVGVTCPVNGYNTATNKATFPIGSRHTVAVIVVLEQGGFFCQSI